MVAVMECPLFLQNFMGRKISVPVIGSTLHISIRVVLSYLLIGRMGLEAVATGIVWISVVLYQIVVYRKVRKKDLSKKRFCIY